MKEIITVTDRLCAAELSISATAHTVWVFPYFMETQVTSRDLM